MTTDDAPPFRVYLAGPMRGLPRYNFEAFQKAATRIRSWGWYVASPAEHDLDYGFDPDQTLEAQGFDLDAAFRWDIDQMLSVDAVVVLPGWERSSGVAAELAVARAVGRTVYEYDPDDTFTPVITPAEQIRRINEVAGWVQPTANNAASVFPSDRIRYVTGEMPITEALLDDAKAANLARAGFLNAARSVVGIGEVRVIDSTTGGEKGSKLARFDLIPAEALWALAEHYGRGAQKYDDDNWRKGYSWRLSFAAMMRHAWAFWRGEDLDDETGSHHLTAVAWHAFTLRTFWAESLGTDDRPE